MREPFFDLAVIGAGPAGCMAAGTAADFGLSVLLLEKTNLPRYKPCGGLLSQKALLSLPFHVGGTALPFNPVREIRVEDNGASYYYRSKQVLAGVSLRARLDLELSRWSSQKGAVVLERSPLTGLRHSSPDGYYLLNSGSRFFRSRYLVGADGCEGPTANLAGIRKRLYSWESGLGFSLGIKTVATDNNPALTFFPLPFCGGFAWIFPGDGFLNIGAGGWRPFQRGIYRAFNNLCRRKGVGSDAASSVKPYRLPFTGLLKKVTDGKRLLLVGDAAGFVDPFSGEGLYQALQSGLLAARAVIKEKKGEVESCSDYYTQEIRKRFLPDFQLSLKAALTWRWGFSARPLPGRIAAVMMNRAGYSPLAADSCMPETE